MKIIILLVSLLISGISSPLFNRENKICWQKGRILKWNDFKGSVPKGRGFSAETFIILAYDMVSLNKMRISNCMIKNKSWAVKQERSQTVIVHEQYHFNIAEIYARKIRQELSSTSNLTNTKIKDIFNLWIGEHNLEQNRYDSETAHSSNIQEQKKWELKIDSLLNGLDNFCNETIILSGSFAD